MRLLKHLNMNCPSMFIVLLHVLTEKKGSINVSIKSSILSNVSTFSRTVFYWSLTGPGLLVQMKIFRYRKDEMKRRCRKTKPEISLWWKHDLTSCLMLEEHVTGRFAGTVYFSGGGEEESYKLTLSCFQRLSEGNVSFMVQMDASDTFMFVLWGL